MVSTRLTLFPVADTEPQNGGKNCQKNTTFSFPVSFHT